MPRRFFVPGPLQAGPLRLTGPEGHHLVHVLRIKTGEEVVVFDGDGLEAQAEVTDVAPDHVVLHVSAAHPGNTEAAVALVLAVAVPKGDRFGWLIEKATELGVHRFVPLITERSVVVPGEGKLERARRTIVEASKQCGRARLMELSPPTDWRELVERELPGRPAWVAHPGGKPVDLASVPESGPFVAAVGPEGGFTDGELELAMRSGAMLISLGPRVLRIETAALALAALFTACR